MFDRTGIKVEGEGEWLRRKHGGSKRRIWRKNHIAADEQTLEFRVIAVTSSTIGDAPILLNLLDQIASQKKIICVAEDGTSATRSCHDAIAIIGPAAAIPPRKSARLWETHSRRCQGS